MKAKQFVERLMNALFFLCGVLAIASVALIAIYMIVSGIPAIHEIGLLNFLTGEVWASTAAEPKFGILPFILTSVYGTAAATLIGVPVGLFTAVFLAKIAPRRVADKIRPAIDLLAGIPSVVYGLVGVSVLVPLIAQVFGPPLSVCPKRRWPPCRPNTRRPALPLGPPISRRFSGSASRPPAAALPPVWCWALAAPSAKRWQL